MKVYRMAYNAAMEIFEVSKNFPKEEKYSLVDQMRRASRSVCANIAEGYRKREYPKHFALKMTDADAETSETTVWLVFAKDCGYIDSKFHQQTIEGYNEIGRMLGGMARNPEKFKQKQGELQ